MEIAKRLLIGVFGGSGSGKTSICNCISSWSSCTLIVPIDSYYNPVLFSDSIKTNFDKPNCIDKKLLVNQVTNLKNGKAVHKPVYDFTTHQRLDIPEKIIPKRNIIVEGLFSCYWKELRDLYDLIVYIHAPADVRLARRIRRDVVERDRSVNSVLNQYLDTVRPGHKNFLLPIIKYADITLDSNKVDIETNATNLQKYIDNLEV
ncbi:uridine kinase [Desulfogranum marinum]|uniref:uridine kinase n=1 Tax=Desulfogranum marinum TaxID=453220 RepID=UPI0029C8AB52|nr:uridine kinase [Desulfogranum marinum]